MRGLLAAVAVVAVLVATNVTFSTVTTHEFLNWDDPDVVAANPALDRPRPALISWAFTTRHMGHYQPLSWLVFASFAPAPRPAAVHRLALGLHALNAVLLLLLIARWLRRAHDDDESRWWVALGVAALFAVHPLRVEPVAWASALPYLLSYAPLLLAALAWIDWARTDTPRSRWAAVSWFAVSQLARVTAPLLPLALIAVARAVPDARPRPLSAIVRAAWPFALIAAPLALVEAAARQPASFSEIGVAPRLAWALTHPAAYAWQQLVPGPHNPLHALPRIAIANWDVAVVAVLASVVVVALTATLVSAPAAWAIWGTYAALLAPVVGLLPSGLQLVADRYSYGPAMVLAVGGAAAVHRLTHPAGRGLVLTLLGAGAVVAALSTQTRLPVWRDSVSFWTRAIAADPDNDVALYNLALAEAAAGRPDAAIDHLQRLVVLVPDHDLGRQTLAGLVADREVRAAEQLATAARLVEAVAAYTRALDADASRTRALVGRGMALVQLGRTDGAAADLAAAVERGEGAPAVVNALAFAWAATGKAGDAIGLLRRTVAVHPADVGLSANLARLLATAEPSGLRAPEEALAIAARLNEDTQGSDPRILDTLATALQGTGRTREAAQAWAAAEGIARERGDLAMAKALAAKRDRTPP